MKTVKFLKNFKGLGLSTKKGDTKDVHVFHANVLVKKGFAEIQEKELKETYKTKEKASMPISNPYPQDSVSETVESDDTNVFMPEKIIALINNEAINTQASDMVSKNKTGKIEPIKNPLPLQMIPDNSKDAAIKNSLGLKQNKQWQIGFNFSLGVAATKNGYLGIIGSGNGDGLKSFADMAQNTGSTTGQGATISYIPAKIQSGAGVTVGVFVQKNISPKTNFLIGLNYKKYSSAMMIGGRVDSFVIVSNFNRVNEFYRSGDKIKYKNNFHFIELPVALQIKLGKQKKAPVYFNTGVSISQLLGSNALQFDTRSGAYYSNNALLNKTQVNVSAGFLFSLSGNAKYPFLIGPDMNYSLTKMAKSGLFKNRHYSYFGIQVQKVIGKK